MKRLITSIALALSVLMGFSQYSLLTVFSDEGETFHLYVNGEMINSNPESHITNIMLINDFNRIKVIGISEKELHVKKQLEAKDMDGNYCRLTLCIKRNRSGKYKMKLTDFTPIPDIEFDKPQPEIVYVDRGTNNTNTTQSKRIVKTSTTTTGNTNVSFTVNANNKSKGEEESVSMSINVAEGNNSASVSFNVSASESSNGKTVITESSSEETITVNSGTTTSTQTTIEETTIISEETGDNSYNKTTTIESHPMPEYNGTIGCRDVILDREMKQIKRAISAKNYDAARLLVAEDIVKKKCLQAKHVRDIIKMFDHDATRLDFAKMAYAHTYDQDNFYIVYNELDLDVNVDELKAFINGEDTNDFKF